MAKTISLVESWVSQPLGYLILPKLNPIELLVTLLIGKQENFKFLSGFKKFFWKCLVKTISLVESWVSQPLGYLILPKLKHIQLLVTLLIEPRKFQISFRVGEIFLEMFIGKNYKFGRDMRNQTPTILSYL